MNRTKNYDGQYIAKVVAVEDGKKRCRVQVNVMDLFDGIAQDDLPWANFVLPMGSRPGEGTTTPAHVGDTVWVKFVNGDSRRPVIVGAAQAAPDGKVNLAPDQWEGEGAYEHKRTDEEPEVEESEYYKDVVFKQNNALIQLCGSGTIRITQMDSGSAVEITKGGDVVIHCEGKMYTTVKGDVLETCEGNYQRKIKGNFSETCEGNVERKVSGNETHDVTGTYNENATSISSNANGVYEITGMPVAIN